MEQTQGNSNINVLSPAELIKHRLPLSKSLPGSHGDKANFPTTHDDGFQKNLLKIQLSERKSILQEERVNRVNTILCGSWVEADKVVLITKRCGDQWSKMGFSKDGKDYLYPEEALFLTETGRMEVKNAGVPMSIQEMYTVMFTGDNLSLEKFQVFSHLTRLGYIVIRNQHNSTSTTETFTEYEKQLGLDKYPSCSSKRKRQESEGSEKMQTSLEFIQPEPCDSSPGMKSNNCKTKSADDIMCLIPRSATQWDVKITFVPSDQDIIDNQAKIDQPCLRFLIPNLHFICDFAYSSMWKCIHIPSKQFLPDNITSQKPSYTIDLRDICRYKRPLFYSDRRNSTFLSNNRRRRDDEESLEWRVINAGTYPYRYVFNYNDRDLYFIRNAAVPQQMNKSIPYGMRKMDWKTDMMYYTGSKTNSERFCGMSKYQGAWVNWRQFKEYLASVDNEEILRNGPMGHLWSQNIKPLLTPKDCATKESVLQRLTLTEKFPFVAPSNEKNSSEEKMPLSIDFDVYNPDVVFKRNIALPPNHRVKVLRAMEPVPDIRDVMKTTAMLEDDSPLYFAIVNNGTVKFVSFSEVNIPHVT